MKTIRIFHCDKNDSKKVIGVDEVPFVSGHPNRGIPDKYFELDAMPLYFIEVDVDRDTVEWVPDVGPNPIWKAKLSDFPDNDSINRALRAWIKENY